MKEPIWVLRETVIAVHHVLLAEHGGLTGIRDKALLDSALLRILAMVNTDSGHREHFPC